MATTLAPAWQTKELEEEWIDYDEENASTHSDSLTQRAPKTHSTPSSTHIVGTVVVKPDTSQEGRVPLATRIGIAQKPIITPARHRLEKIFQPPSPPEPDPVLSSTPAANLSRPFLFNDDGKSNYSFPFTFVQPVKRSELGDGAKHNYDDAQDTRSKLRLFQFQYDTYTRDHLSAIIDSIPLSATSQSSQSRSAKDHRIQKHDIDESPIFRPPKRIKICTDEGGMASKGMIRPRRKRPSADRRRKSHVLDSQELVQAIRETRLVSGTTNGEPRTIASSTVHASEHEVEFTEEDLIEKMEQVTVEQQQVSGSTERTAHTVTTRVPSSSTRIPSGLTQVALPPDERQLPSTTVPLTHIAAADIPPLPEQIGRMQFDKTQYKWFRRPGEESDDPFRDFESVVDYVSSLQNGIKAEQPTIVLNDLDQDVIDIPGEDNESVGSIHVPDGDIESKPSPPAIPVSVQTPLTTPLRVGKALPTPIRSALKNPNNYLTTSVDNRGADTGSSGGKPRSVSFSDGRHSGKIRGLHPSEPEEDSLDSKDEVYGENGSSRSSIQPSFRTKRIADMLDDLEESSHDEGEDTTPCRASSRPHSIIGSHLGSSSSLLSSHPLAAPLSPNPSNFSCSVHASRSMRSFRGGPNATFLTECSFGVAHDRLLQCITDVVPFEPHWETMTSIDLSGKTLDSVARLKEFMPKLEDLILNDNAISWLSGVPAGVRLLSVASNQLTGLTSYVHLTHLESLDISKNQIDSLLQLDCLERLRELKAEHNQITSLAGLYKLSKLRRLSLIGNRLRHVELSGTTWYELEHLDLSQNALETVEGLEHLPNVTYVSLEENVITRLDIATPMSRLRCLRVSDNRLEGSLDVRTLPNVRILYADRNRITGIIHGEKLKRLETLSLRYQSGKGLVLTGRDVRDVRRLYLSGNALGSWALDEPCYNMIYLELADCRLTCVPSKLETMVPNLRVLNLNYNFIGDLGGLEGLTRLKKLSMIGSRLRGTRGIVKALRRMGELEMVDFRMNPCTVSWYVPLLDSREEEWQELDAKFRRGLPDGLYAERLVYRGKVMGMCGRLKVMDGLRITEGERVKAGELLRGIEGKRSANYDG